MSEANVLQKRSFWSVLSTDLLAIADIKLPRLNETKSSQKGPNAATDEALNGRFDLTALCLAPRSLPTAPINIEALALQIRNTPWQEGARAPKATAKYSLKPFRSSPRDQDAEGTDR